MEKDREKVEKQFHFNPFPERSGNLILSF